MYRGEAPRSLWDDPGEFEPLPAPAPAAPARTLAFPEPRTSGPSGPLLALTFVAYPLPALGAGILVLARGSGADHLHTWAVAFSVSLGASCVLSIPTAVVAHRRGLPAGNAAMLVLGAVALTVFAILAALFVVALFLTTWDITTDPGPGLD